MGHERRIGFPNLLCAPSAPRGFEVGHHEAVAGVDEKIDTGQRIGHAWHQLSLKFPFDPDDRALRLR